MTALIRKLAARRRRTAVDEPALPTLVRVCRTCNGEKEIYNEESKEWWKQVEAAEAAYNLRNPNSPFSFYGSYEWENEWKPREPSEFYPCVECDGTGEELTPTGQQIVNFLRSRGVTFTGI